MLKILPQLFYQTPEIDKVLVDGLSCVIHKVLHRPVLHKEGYVSTHAMTLVLKGKLRIENQDSLPVTIGENQMVFLPKGLYTISDIIPDNSDCFEAVVFFFDTEIISDFVKRNNIQPSTKRCLSHKIIAYTPEIRLFTESLLALYKNKQTSDRTMTKLKLYELLHLLTISPSGCLLEALATLNNKERRSLREFMEDNYAKPLSIEDYAYLTGRSLSSFRRDFIALYGISPKQWLIDKRLDKARALLLHHNQNVTRVALEVGYENISHFVKAFHKKFGIAPKQYLMRSRKEVLAEEML